MHDILAKMWCREFWLYALWGRKDQHGVQVGPEATLTFPRSTSKHRKCCYRQGLDICLFISLFIWLKVYF